jgi:hypothetical protein
MAGYHAKPYTRETLENITLSNPPRLLNREAVINERNEKEGLVELRDNRQNIPDDVMWKIDEYVTRNASSRRGGRKHKNTKKRRTRKINRRRRNKRSRTSRRH